MKWRYVTYTTLILLGFAVGWNIPDAIWKDDLNAKLNLAVLIPMWFGAAALDFFVWKKEQK